MKLGIDAMSGDLGSEIVVEACLSFLEKNKTDELYVVGKIEELQALNNHPQVVLIDASKLGEEYQDGTIKKRRLRDSEIEKIISTFLQEASIDDFSVAVTYDEIIEKRYSLAAGQYFDVKIEYIPLSEAEFNEKMISYQTTLQALFLESEKLQKEILDQLGKVKYVEINWI